MFRIFLVLLLIQAAVLPADVALEDARGKLRPSLVEVAKRVLVYAAEGDYERANKAAVYLKPIYSGLEKVAVLPKKHFLPLKPALEAKDLLQIRESLRRMVLADIHFLIADLGRAPTKGGLHPRTWLLMVQQDWKFLEASLGKDKDVDKLKLAVNKLLQSLIQTVPNKSNYSQASGSWEKKATGLSSNILKLLDQAILPKEKHKAEATQ